MRIKKINIENFKCFEGNFTLELDKGINILVGNNEAGKSTILEAIHLALSGVFNGRYLRNELTQYLFNLNVVNKFLSDINRGKNTPLPFILIEVFFEDDDTSIAACLKGNGNSKKEESPGVFLKIEFDDHHFGDEYEKLVESGGLGAIPIEYYKISWKSFARKSITSRSIPLKSAFIDSSSHRFHNGSDIYISRIIKEHLDSKQKAGISQAYRKLKETFMDDEAVKKINRQIKGHTSISDKDVKISVDLSTQNAWESTLMTYLDEIPFHQIGKGEQCIIKTNLALAHEKNENANLILLEEPESHLSHTKLNEFVKNISNKCKEKQILISTHNSFVANKLGLKHLIFINNQKQTRLSDLNKGTQEFFKKLPGYDTLRMLLSQKAVLVEGPSDELIFQKAYMKENKEKLPIEDGIDVISVGLSSKRFLQIAQKISLLVAVITDNDGDYKANIEKKYAAFDDNDFIEIFADADNSLRTLEPQFVEVNNIETLKRVVVKKKLTDEKAKKKLIKFMKNNKAKWAMRVFESDTQLKYPAYIRDAVRWCNE